MTHFDTVVLGAGPGGYVAAIQSAQLGMKTAIVEKTWWGGVCLNVGCIPTKSLLRNAELASIFTRQKAEYGMTGDVSFDYSVAFSRSRHVAERMTKGVHFLMRKNKVTQYDGWGRFSNSSSLNVDLDGGTSDVLTFDNCIIATGATPTMLPGVAASQRILTYEGLIMSDTLPRSIVICGGGPIGVEFAYILANYGVAVTIVEYMDRILPLEDPEISSEIAKAYRNLGVTIMANHSVTAVDDSGECATIHVHPTHGGDDLVLQADAVLVSLGFTPRTAGYGLETTGVDLTERGAIAIDDHMMTSVPGLYAVGDVTAKMMLAHVAEEQGMIAAKSIAGVTTYPINYDMVPRATYCSPQVASFGYTRAQAQANGHDVTVAKFPLTANGKAWALGEGTGFVKIVADAKHHEILGAHMVGPDVTELLPELTLAQMWDLTADEVALNIHAHPTLSEAIKEAAEGISSHMINF